MQNQFRHIKIKSWDPYERGIQYGRQASDLIEQALKGYKRHFNKTIGIKWEDIVKKSDLYIPYTERFYPNELSEMRGIASGSGFSAEEIMALNCRYEILKFKQHECTTGVLLQDATKEHKVFLLQNWDYRPWVERHAVIIDIDDERGTHIIGVTEAGQLVRNGMNNYGVGLCANNLTSIYDTGEIGAPVTFVRRKALNCRSYRDLRNTIFYADRGVSCNFLLASKENCAVDLEATPGAVFSVNPEFDILTHANHMIEGASVCTNNGNKFRDKVLRRLLLEEHGKIDLDLIKTALKNHERFPGAGDTYPDVNCIEAVCSHTPHGDYDEDDVWKTISSSIYNLTDGIAYICKGCPCEGEYIEYRL